MKLVYL